MESHEALERLEKVVQGNEEAHGEGGKLARTAAIVAAVLAAFLAIATYLGSQATTKVITDETKGGDTQAQREANDVVLAGISILVRREWLLACGVLLGAAGVGFLFTGLARTSGPAGA